MDEGFAVDVDDLVTHFIVKCDEKYAIFAIKCVMYIEGLGTTVIFFLEVGGGEVIAGT